MSALGKMGTIYRINHLVLTISTHDKYDNVKTGRQASCASFERGVDDAGDSGPIYSVIVGILVVKGGETTQGRPRKLH
jgi:hypothetical protein